MLEFDISLCLHQVKLIKLCIALHCDSYKCIGERNAVFIFLYNTLKLLRLYLTFLKYYRVSHFRTNWNLQINFRQKALYQWVVWNISISKITIPLIKVFSPTDVQLDSLKNNFKFALKLTLKSSYMFRCKTPSSGSTLSEPC
jgi:hypothetical protein